MTCVVGLVNNGIVYMGADSAGVGGFSLAVRADEKVFHNGEFIMGFTTSFRMGQLLRFKLNPPKQHPDMDDYEYMVIEFVDAVRQCLKDGGFARTHNGEEEGGKFLVGYKGNLYKIDDDYQVAKLCDNYAAVGCGEDIALGSLYSTESFKLGPKERILLALKASEQYSAGVRGPFKIISSDKKKVDSYGRVL